MRKSTVIIFALSVVVFIATAFTHQQTPVRYKNLKVLPKKTTKAELDTIMKHFTNSLGVKCGACHVRGKDAQRNWDFANDSNENKNTARGMMRMTARINKKFFKEINNEKNIKIVTCYTCHNGKEQPGMRAPAPPPGPPGGPGGPGGQQRPPQGAQGAPVPPPAQKP